MNSVSIINNEMRWLSISYIISFLLLALAAPPATAAIHESRQFLDYNIFVGGMKTFSANLSITRQDDGDYALTMDARTDGLLKRFKTWKGTMETRGHLLDDGQTLPSFHEFVSVWPDNTKINRFSWSKAGSLETVYISDKEKTRRLEDIDNNLAAGSVDIMTAALEIMQAVAESGSCEGKTEVFDGKRRYRLAAVNRGREMLKASRYNKYQGEALRCEIRITPQQGDWHGKLRAWMSIQEQGREAGAVPTVWLAKLKGGPAVPVKLKAKTKYGTILMHLSGYR